MTPYMCTVCGNAFASSEGAKSCNHKKPVRKAPPKPKVQVKEPEVK